MSAHTLRVTTGDALVGTLTFDSREERYGFDYDTAWRQRRGAFPLSPHIPLSGEVAAPGAVQRFLQNLLPEGRALDVASVVNQISKENVFGLVRVLGKEPVGALSFAPTADLSSAPGEAALPLRRPISAEELSQRIRERDLVDFPVWDGKVRLSVAGYQDKLQVLAEGTRLALADGALSSTHILKPESRNAVTPYMVANEHFCMTLAARLGLKVAPVEIRRIPEPILLIERFDREVAFDPVDGETVIAVRRRHVIDGCQALDLPVSFKYERNFGNVADVRNIREGVSFEKLFALEPYFDNPLSTRTFLVRWALLHALIGNSDAHGKNISFFMRASNLEPAPLYDLVSVNAYGERVEQDMAMAYGDVFRLQELTPYALADFAQCTGTQPRFLEREMVRMARQASALAPELARAEVYVGEERTLVDEVARFVVAQSQALLKLAPEVPKVDRNLF
ncbi:HipA domain-containing protein [Paraburkholderia sp.]|uniref:HipA domain-containing protein n=1 Tax=Paraburkholderia sp. TaxID=1926495 RepID=UPI00286EE07C|nr:HipA domain-containing protein [Paraburkholderia sp.]